MNNRYHFVVMDTFTFDNLIEMIKSKRNSFFKEILGIDKYDPNFNDDTFFKVAYFENNFDIINHIINHKNFLWSSNLIQRIKNISIGEDITKIKKLCKTVSNKIPTNYFDKIISHVVNINTDRAFELCEWFNLNPGIFLSLSILNNNIELCKRTLQYDIKKIYFNMSYSTHDICQNSKAIYEYIKKAEKIPFQLRKDFIYDNSYNDLSSFDFF